jgi:threonine dehydrogenase-like Zn-dependent dehydrogenase
MTHRDLPRAIALVGSGDLSLSELVTDRYGLPDADAAFNALAERRGLKIVVEPNA